jgi:hypothetical protein
LSAEGFPDKTAFVTFSKMLTFSVQEGPEQLCAPPYFLNWLYYLGNRLLDFD